MGSQQKRKNVGRRKSDRELQAQFELLKIIAEQNHEILFEYDVKSDCALLYEVRNAKFVARVIMDQFQVNFDIYLELFRETQRPMIKKALKKCLMKKQHQVIDVECQFNGDMEWYRFFLASMANEDGEIITIAGRFLSIHKEKMANERIRHRAEIDALTGVYNHITFESLCAKKMESCEGEVLFLMMDVDDFKIINDSLGHNVGDMVLSQTGDVLNRTIGENGIAGRLGGDEFAALVWGFENREKVEEFCTELRSSLKNIIFDMEYSASMGACIRAGRPMTFKDMYYEADQAVYAAKKNGKNQFVFYDDVIEEEPEKEVDKPKSKTKVLVSGRNVDVYYKHLIDEKDEYIFLVDTRRRKICYVNKAARKVMDLSVEELMRIPCNELFYDDTNSCQNCMKTGERYYIISAGGNGSKALERLLGTGDFLVHSTLSGQGDIYREISLISLRNLKQMNTAMLKKSEVQIVLKKYMKLILEDSGTLNYSKSLQLLMDFYDADCVAVIHSNDGKYNELEEIHRPNAEVMAKILEEAVGNGNHTKYHGLLDDNGRIHIRKVNFLKESNPVLYHDLVEIRIWSMLGKTLVHKGVCSGVLVLLNPRQNTGEDDILKLVSLYLATELIRQKLESTRSYETSHDVITGLLNRKMLSVWNEETKQDNSKALGIFVTDILALKDINNEFGFQQGNERLYSVADVLREVFAGFDIYRYDADEMIAVCADVARDDFEKMCIYAREKLEELDFLVASGYSWKDEAFFKGQISEAEQILESDKEDLRHRRDISKTITEKVRKDVESGLADGKFLVYLQPKVDIRTEQTVGAEALVRLQTEKLGIVGPAYFIDILEEHDMVYLIDLFVLEQVALFQREKLDAGERVVPISVNFSKRTMLYIDLLKEVARIMDRYAVPQNLIQIEITETIGDMDYLMVSNIAQSLQSMGFTLVMDDFGTKYSNLEMLSKYPFSVAKIDRSLVKEIESNAKSCTILRHLTAMLSELGIECVIEGAETSGQIELLREMSCNVVQGFFYGKPVNCEGFYQKYIRD